MAIIASFSFDWDNHPMAYFRIVNGSKRELTINAMIDTGCTYTSISYETGFELGFAYPSENEKRKYVQTANGAKIPYVFRRVDIWIGNKKLEGFSLAWFLAEGGNYLGCDILKHFKIILDKRNNSITFEDDS